MAGPDDREGLRAREEHAGAAAARRRVWVSRTPGRIVVRCADGRVLKGYADFDPDAPDLRLVPRDPAAEPVVVPLAALKAVFFVRSFDGDPAYSESKDLYQPRPPGTRKVSVTFVDGEELVGYTRQVDRFRTGLFFTPLDGRSNNLRVFAVLAAVAAIRRLL